MHLHIIADFQFLEAQSSVCFTTKCLFQQDCLWLTVARRGWTGWFKTIHLSGIPSHETRSFTTKKRYLWNGGVELPLRDPLKNPWWKPRFPFSILRSCAIRHPVRTWSPWPLEILHQQTSQAFCGLLWAQATPGKHGQFFMRKIRRFWSPKSLGKMMIRHEILGYTLFSLTPILPGKP